MQQKSDSYMKAVPGDRDRLEAGQSNAHTHTITATIQQQAVQSKNVSQAPTAKTSEQKENSGRR